MPAAYALQHLASNVERGYFPARGTGFQTVALSEALVGTPDLRAIEDIAAYYEVSAERRAAGELPVKETCFRLPSGSVAIGRTVDWGSSSTGRSGNSLALHWVLTEADYRALGADPFGLLDGAWPPGAGADLTPRLLEPVPLSPASTPDVGSLFAAFPEVWTRALIAAAAGATEKPALVIGPEASSRRLLRALYQALPLEQRVALTFCTHFSRACDHLRKHFRLATVRTGAEGPAQRQSYLTLDLEARTVRPEAEPGAAGGPFAQWLAGALTTPRWEEIHTVQQALAAPEVPLPVGLPSVSAVPVAALAAVGELAPEKLPALLNGDCSQVAALLNTASEPRRLADSLLPASSPALLCGAGTAEARSACLGALRSAASPSVWKSWEKRYAGDSLLKDLPRSGWTFWRK